VQGGLIPKLKKRITEAKTDWVSGSAKCKVRVKNRWNVWEWECCCAENRGRVEVVGCGKIVFCMLETRRICTHLMTIYDGCLRRVYRDRVCA
jgi:hypothetical protein